MQKRYKVGYQLSAEDIENGNLSCMTLSADSEQEAIEIVKEEWSGIDIHIVFVKIEQ